MTKEETVKIMSMLGAFYSGGKNNPQIQAQAWHLILAKYDYKTAERAVLRFAEEDQRDYATFPAVGKIVAMIRKEQTRIEAPVKEVVRSVAYGKPFEQLSEDAKSLIDKEIYDGWLNIDAFEFSAHMDEYADYLRSRRMALPLGEEK